VLLQPLAFFWNCVQNFHVLFWIACNNLSFQIGLDRCRSFAGLGGATSIEKKMWCCWLVLFLYFPVSFVCAEFLFT
jgi:hypothetical protein